MDATDQMLKELKEDLLRLCRFTNERRLIVREEVMHSEEQRVYALELIGRVLWRDTSLIDDYITANPDHLPGSRLARLKELKSAIYGDFLLWRQDGPKTILLHTSGIYQVFMPSGFAARDSSDLPLIIRGAISSYQGTIVGVTPFTALGSASESHFSSLVDDNASQDRLYLVDNGPMLAERASWWKQHCKEKVQQGEPAANGPVKGFHRSVLAGLSGEERKQERRKRLDERLVGSDVYRASLEARSIKAHYFPFSLKEGLELLDDDWLVDIYEDVGSQPPSHDASRSELIDMICHDLLADEEERDLSLLWCSEEQYKLLAALMRTNPLSLMTLSPSEVMDLYPMIPYVFILQDEDAFVAWMPPEVRTFVSKADLSSIATARMQLRQAARAADALATMCGIISEDDAYDRYRRAVTDPLDRREFHLALIELEECAMRDAYSLWEHEGVTYLVCVELSDSSAQVRAIRDSFLDFVIAREADSLDDRLQGTLPVIETEDEDEIRCKVAKLEERLEQVRLSLLASQEGTPCDIPPQMLTCRPVEALLETERLCDLRAYIDEHVPDGEDDLSFADIFARSVIISSLIMGEGYEETLDIIRVYGMQHCEGTEFSDTMGRLVTNAFNTLPRPVLSGHSLEERTRLITGRKRLYNPDGTVVEVPDDESPSLQASA